MAFFPGYMPRSVIARSYGSSIFRLFFFSFFFFFFLLFRAAPVSYVSSQAGGRIGAVAAGHSYSNM